MAMLCLTMAVAPPQAIPRGPLASAPACQHDTRLQPLGDVHHAQSPRTGQHSIQCRRQVWDGPRPQERHSRTTDMRDTARMEGVVQKREQLNTAIQ